MSRPARLAGTWNVYEGDFDLFRGVGGEGREVFLWCRRTGVGSSSGVSIDSDLLFIGLREDDDDGNRGASGRCVGWTTGVGVVGRFELRRKVACHRLRQVLRCTVRRPGPRPVTAGCVLHRVAARARCLLRLPPVFLDAPRPPDARLQ